MLSVVAPGKLVLTLQSIPPFVVESILALTLAVLLALPLILRVQQFLGDSRKPASCPADLERKRERDNERVVTHYPVSTFDTASSSSADLHLDSVRRTISSPTLKASGDSVLTKRRNGKTRSGLREGRGRTSSAAKQNGMPLKQSSSYIVTNSELPIVDISAFDYGAYRYKLMEAALRNRYEDYQPPGNVVLNSIHLNDDDSVVAVQLNDKYHHSLFDFVEEYYDATTKMSKKETDYMHPLDHFLVKGTQKPETVERQTETKTVEVTDAGQDDMSLRISFCDDTAVDGSGQKMQEPTSRKSLRPTKGRSSSAGADSSASKRSPFPRCFSKRSTTKFWRTTSSTDTLSSKRDTLSSLHRREDKRDPLSSMDRVERESMNCTTVSSIDSESSRSEYSKPRSCHSRDSSVTSRRGPPEKSKIQPWLAGNPRTFNKKYGNTGRTSSKMFEMSRRNSATRRSSSLASKRQDSKQSVHPNLECIDQPAGKTFAKFGSPARTGDLKPASHLGKLESIKSETEEFPRSEFRSTSDNLTPTPRRATPLNRPGTLTSPRTTAPDPIASPAETSQQRPADPKLTKNSFTTRAENAEERSARSRQGQAEKRPEKPWLDRRLRSRAVFPTLQKQRSAKTELTPDALVSRPPRRDQKLENLGFKANEFPIKRRREKTEPSFGGLNSAGRGNATDSIRAREDGRKCDSSRGRASGAIKSQTPRSTGRGNPCPVGKQLAGSAKSSRQRPTTAGSGPNGSLHDNTIAGRSMQIRSGKPAAGERRAAGGRKPGENETAGRSGSKETSPDGFRLPRRDSKAGIAMQTGLKKYIKKMKRALSDREPADIGELASLSLTDAILPELRSALSTVEVEQVQNALTMAEKKSNLGRKDLS